MKPRMLPKIRCTVAQKMALIDYMWDHRRLARYEYDAYTSEKEWFRLAETLNQTGSVKTVDKWKVTWRDLKRKALREVQAAVENNTIASESALKIREILISSDDALPRPKTRHHRMSPSPLHSVTVHMTPEDTYQGQSIEDQEQSQEYSEPDRASPNGLELESIECTPDLSSDSSSISTQKPLTKTRSNQDQINTLVECMALNTHMAFGNQGTVKKHADWKRLRRLLNRMGPAKRTAAWQQSWRDLKRNALERNSINTKSNTPLTQKIVGIVTAYNEGRDTTSYEDTIHSDQTLSLPTQVKHLIQPNTNYNQVPIAQYTGQSSTVVSIGQPDLSAGQRGSAMPTITLMPLRQHRQRYKPKTRSTNTQILALVDYMEKHPGLAVAKSIAGDTKCPYVAQWRKLSSYLNRVGTARRSTMAWKRTWRDLKKTAKKEPDNERNSYLNKKILDILEKAGNSESNIDTGDLDALPFAADFDQVSSGQMSPEQLSGRYSPVSENGQSQEGDQLLNTSKKITRCTNAQKHALVDYMRTHLALATSKFIGALGCDPYYAEWRQLSKYLNKIGTAKSTISWKRTWRDLKLSVLKKKKSNGELFGLDRKISEICENDPTELFTEPTREFDSLPDPTDGMPVFYLQSPEQTPNLTYDQDRSHGDPANEDPQQNSPKPGQDEQQEMSPERPDEMPPEQQSAMSPGRLNAMSPEQQNEMSPELQNAGSPGQQNEMSSEQTSEASPGHNKLINIKDNALKKTRRPRCTQIQINELVHYMERHPHLARGRCLYLESETDPTYEDWRRLVRYLNQVDRSIPPKSVTKWKCTWRTLVINARRKDRKRSAWNDRISRKILQILNENGPDDPNEKNEDRETQPEDYVYTLSSNEHLTLSDPLKCEPGDAEHERQDCNIVRTPRKRRLNIRRSSILQLRTLADYMTAHPELTLNCQLNDRNPAWVRITRQLNSLGPARSSAAWRTTWRDLKMRVRDRARRKQTSNTLQGFREKRVLKLIEMTSPSDIPETDCDTIGDYSTQPPAPRSPRSALRGVAEILARQGPHTDRDSNSKTSATASGSSETNHILRELVLELKRSNELKSEQNGYLKELLSQLKPPTCTHARQTDIPTHTADRQADRNPTDIQKQDDTLEEPSEYTSINGVPMDTNDEIPVDRTPVIRPVALTSLTTVNTPGQNYKRVNVQSIVRSEPRDMHRRLVRLKDGTMVLMPHTVKTQARSNQDNSGELYVVCGQEQS